MCAIEERICKFYFNHISREVRVSHANDSYTMLDAKKRHKTKTPRMQTRSSTVISLVAQLRMIRLMTI